MVRGKRRDDQGAASGVIAFMIAGILFMASIVAVLATTRTTNDRESTSDASDGARFAIQANSLAGILLGSPGYFRAADGTLSALDWSHAAEFDGWTPDADRLDRLGLLDANAREPSMMDFAKFQNLRRAGYKACPSPAGVVPECAADGYVNYEEAVRNLGLSNAGLDFHIRAYPTLDSVKDLLAADARDDNLRVTYVGDIEVITQKIVTDDPDITPTYRLSMTPPVCEADSEDHPRAFRLRSTVTNGEASSATTQFTAVTVVHLDPAVAGSKPQQQNVNSFEVLPGQSVDLVVDVAALPGRSCAGAASAVFDLYDPVHAKLLTATSYGGAVKPDGTTTGTCNPGATPPKPCMGTPATAPATTAFGLVLDTDKQNYRPTDRIFLDYDGTNLKGGEKLFLRVCEGTAECTTADAKFAGGALNKQSGTYESNGEWFTAPTPDKKRHIGIGWLPAGNYTAWLYDCESVSCGNVNAPANPSPNAFRVTEKILVTASAVDGYQPPVVFQDLSDDPEYKVPDGPALEVYNLELLMGKFCPSFHNTKDRSPLEGWDAAKWAARCSSFKGATPLQPGDVFSDSKKVMNEDLPLRLLCQEAAGCPGAGHRVPGTGGRLDVADGQPRYDITDVLVIGSGVDHNAMTSQSAKGAIESWVHGGGTILVFGSTAGNVRWLEPLFHAAIVGTGEAISTPDQGHPMLHTPNELDNPGVNYNNQNSAWRFNGQTAKAQGTDKAVFSNIVLAGDDDPLLALSNKGSFGGGTIIVTAFMPYDIYGTDPTGDDPTWLRDPTCSRPYNSATDSSSRTLEQCEGMFFMHNMLMQGYADLYLEYGPHIPANANVQPSQRLAQIRHPQFADPIELTMIVYVFRSV